MMMRLFSFPLFSLSFFRSMPVGDPGIGRGSFGLCRCFCLWLGETSRAEIFLYSAPPRLPVCSRACLLPCLRCALVVLLLSIFVSACCDGVYACVLSSCRLGGSGAPVQRIVVRRSKAHESLCNYVHLSAAFAMLCLMAYVVRFCKSFDVVCSISIQLQILRRRYLKIQQCKYSEAFPGRILS